MLNKKATPCTAFNVPGTGIEPVLPLLTTGF